MRQIRLPLILVLLVFGLLLTSDVPQPVYADEEPEIISGTLEDVYGSVGLWGLGYSDPTTYSYHSTYLRNHKTRSITYNYEWNHSVIDFITKDAVAEDSAWIHGRKPLKPGRIWTIYSERRSVDLDAKGVRQGRWYYLDCYTEINVHGVKGSWKHRIKTSPFRHQ